MNIYLEADLKALFRRYEIFGDIEINIKQSPKIHKVDLSFSVDRETPSEIEVMYPSKLPKPQL